jgi:hypothetical protein
MAGEQAVIHCDARNVLERFESGKFVEELKKAMSCKSIDMEYGRGLTMTSFGLPVDTDEYLGFTFVKIQTKEKANNEQVFKDIVDQLTEGGGVFYLPGKSIKKADHSTEHSFCVVDQNLFGDVTSLFNSFATKHMGETCPDFLANSARAITMLKNSFFEAMTNAEIAIRKRDPRRILLTLCILRVYLCAYTHGKLTGHLHIGSTMGWSSVKSTLKKSKRTAISENLKVLRDAMNSLVELAQTSTSLPASEEEPEMKVETPAAGHGDRVVGLHGPEESDSVLVYVENTYTVDAWEYLVRSDKMPDRDGGLLFNRNNNSRRNVRQKIDLDGQEKKHGDDGKDDAQRTKLE